MACELQIVDAEGTVLPNDGETQGDLQIRGHWIVECYFGKPHDALTDDGWFETGDVATIDPDGYMVIPRSLQGYHQIRRRVDLDGGA